LRQDVSTPASGIVALVTLFGVVCELQSLFDPQPPDEIQETL
jgi:hypothetical protein